MSQIQISNLSFRYPGQTEYIFQNVSLTLDTNWKLGVNKDNVDKNLEDLSEGQKKKVMIARSISEDSEIYIWDEPLNYLDIQSREQVESMILRYKPTMIFIEHDDIFINKVATKIIKLDKS